jgi:hypothetical protein
MWAVVFGWAAHCAVLLGRGEQRFSCWAAQLRTRIGRGQRANRRPQAGFRARMKVKVYEFVLFFFRSVFEVLCKDFISIQF